MLRNSATLQSSLRHFKTKKKERNKEKKLFERVFLLIDWVNFTFRFVHIICMFDAIVFWAQSPFYASVCSTWDLTRNDCKINFLGLTIDSAFEIEKERRGSELLSGAALRQEFSCFESFISKLNPPLVVHVNTRTLIPIIIIILLVPRAEHLKIPYLHKNLNHPPSLRLPLGTFRLPAFQINKKH